MTLQLDDIAAIPVSSQLHTELVRRSPQSVSSVVEDLVWDFLNRTERDFVAKQKTPKNGVQLGQGFLANWHEASQ